MADHAAHEPAQLRQFGRVRHLVTAEREQGRAADARQPPSLVPGHGAGFGVPAVIGFGQQGATVGRLLQRQPIAEFGKKVAFEPTQRPGRAFGAMQACQAGAIVDERTRLRVAAPAQAQHEFVDVHRRRQHLAWQRQRRACRFGATEIGQFAAACPVEQQRLQGLQHAARPATAFAAHATRDQADAAMVAREDLEQQRRLAPGARMQHIGRLLVDAHEAAGFDRSGHRQRPLRGSRSR